MGVDIYVYLVYGERCTAKQAAARLGIMTTRLRAIFNQGRESYHGIPVDRRLIDGSPEPGCRPLGLERWLMRRERIWYGGMIRVEVRR